jgi:hypothetical protein
LKGVNDTHHQRHFRADDGQADSIFLHELNQAIDVFYADINIFQPGFAGSTGVARGHEDLIYCG